MAKVKAPDTLYYIGGSVAVGFFIKYNIAELVVNSMLTQQVLKYLISGLATVMVENKVLSKNFKPAQIFVRGGIYGWLGFILVNLIPYFRN